MILYHNTDISKLDSICENGLLPADACGGSDWKNGRRAGNSTSVVYLSLPTSSSNSFVNFGAALLVIDTDRATLSSLGKTDCGNGQYDEYIVDFVEPESIVKILIPEVFKDLVLTHINLSSDTISKIEWCEIHAEVFQKYVPNPHDRFGSGGTCIYRAATNEEFNSLVLSKNIFESSSFNYFRAVSESGEMIDFKNVRYSSK